MNDHNSDFNHTSKPHTFFLSNSSSNTHVDEHNAGPRRTTSHTFYPPYHTFLPDPNSTPLIDNSPASDTHYPRTEATSKASRKDTVLERAEVHALRADQGKFKRPGDDSYVDENDNHTTKRVKRTGTESDFPKVQNFRLACPYFKHDPVKYGQRSSCSGPGWESVHRLKGHLYRCHTKPIKCRRCGVTQANTEALLDHLSQDIQCERSVSAKESFVSEGLSETQEKFLRKRAQQGQSETERWEEVYRIIFPDAVEDEIPSPFYDLTNTHRKVAVAHQSPTNPISNVFDSRRQELEFSVIRKNVETAVEELIHAAAKRLQERIPEIIHASQEEITRQLQQRATPQTQRQRLNRSPIRDHGARNPLATSAQLDDVTASNLLPKDSPIPQNNSRIIHPHRNQPLPANAHFPPSPPSPGFGPSTESLHGMAIEDVDWDAFDESLINFDWSQIGYSNPSDG